MGRVVFRAQVAWIPRLPLFCGALASIFSRFFLPLPFFRCFFFPSGCWLAFGLVVCMECTSDVWVGEVAKEVV
jgi:hypothetical protein